jgi:PKD repeat protein
MRPCGVQVEAQSVEGLTWAQVRDSEFVWDFDASNGDNGSDADGFMAAHVYDTAGTYTITLRVDGDTWNTKQVIVTDPTTVACVSTSQTWTGCSYTNNCAGGTSPPACTYTSLTTALNNTGSNTHILLRGGESFGSIPDADSATNVLIGAYNNGTSNPAATSTQTIDSNERWIYQDINLTCTNQADVWCFGTVRRGAMIRRINATNGYQFIHTLGDSYGGFVVDNVTTACLAERSRKM